MDVSELSVESVGVFDIVLCLGVLYHLRYPIEGLEKVCAVTRDVCIVDTFVMDGERWLAGERSPMNMAEFYERRELGGQLDNWWGPSVETVAAWIRTAGFARAELLAVTGTTARYAAHRTWGELPPATAGAVRLLGLSSHANRGQTFRSSKEEYISLWVEWSQEEVPELTTVYPEVGEFGIAPLFCSLDAGAMQIVTRVPPGLRAGKHEARVRIGAAGWSQASAFYLDLTPIDSSIRVLSVQDGVSWAMSEIDWNTGGWATVWLQGLTAEADAGNVTIFVDGIPHLPQDVFASTGQVNFQLRPVLGSGEQELYAEHRGACSGVVGVNVLGVAPVVRGLENLAGH
jgi:hypothetical protein